MTDKKPYGTKGANSLCMGIYDLWRYRLFCMSFDLFHQPVTQNGMGWLTPHYWYVLSPVSVYIFHTARHIQPHLFFHEYGRRAFTISYMVIMQTLENFFPGHRCRNLTWHPDRCWVLRKREKRDLFGLLLISHPSQIGEQISKIDRF